MTLWFLPESRRPYRAGQRGLSYPDQMSGNEDVKTQEHRMQQVKANGAGPSGAYNEGVLYRS